MKWTAGRWFGLAVLVLLVAASASAQNTSTINGRVLDEGAGALPGVTVTATNTRTGVARTTFTNAEGTYSLPGLEPGTYNIVSELTGFATRAREVTITVNTTITMDFSMAIAGLQESVTVTGDAPLIEVTQSKVTSTIETTELQSLPMIARNVSGMLALLPGAVQIAGNHRSKVNVGSVSYGGAGGTNVAPTVDGADNRDNQYGGPLLTFSTEALEQFQLSSSQFNAADGRTGGAALTMITKSGTNELHGSFFGFGRSEKLQAKDFFTAEANRDKDPYSRAQYGGSAGGPISQNRAFYFGAIERIQEELTVPVPQNLFDQLEWVVAAVDAGQIDPKYVYRDHPSAAQQPVRQLMLTGKVNTQLNNDHGLMARYHYQREYKAAATFAVSNDLREPENLNLRMWSGVGQHNWVFGGVGLSQLTFQVNHLYRLSDSTSNNTGEHYTRDFPNVPVFPARLDFPSVTTGAGGGSGSITDTSLIQIKEEISRQTGTHALKFGANFNYMGDIGLLNGNEHYPTLEFFDDPSVIFNNTNGRYPQGFQTPGIVALWQQANPVLANSLIDAQQYSGWFQDDWRVTPQMTLNLGVRYDYDVNFYDQQNYENNLTRLALLEIGNEKAALPKTPASALSPRFGFAYDLSGDGRRVIRGGGGVYFDQFNMNGGNISDIYAQNRRPMNALAELTNSQIGVGELANFVFGRDPLPAQPTKDDALPLGARGRWLDPDVTNPRTYAMHVGYAHELATNTTLEVDYTHSLGRKELRTLNINPRVNGQRVLAPAFESAFGNPNFLGVVDIFGAINKSQYDALVFKVRKRSARANIQAHYTLARANAYGGSTGLRGGAPVPVIQDQPFGAGEWGPTPTDERHRFVAVGVFEVGYGVQLSPVFQAASARPYNLTAGRDLNADGTNNDRYVDPATGQMVSVNSARGDATYVLDLRTTKFIDLGGARRLGLFAEAFNLLNTANFGNSYNGNGRSASFQQPTGFVSAIGYARALQLGARFLF